MRSYLITLVWALFNHISAFIAFRFSNSSTKNSFIAFINRFSIIGICLGIAALIIVSSVMNGLEEQLKKRVLGLQPHIQIMHPSTVELPESLNQYVKSQHAYFESEMIIQSRSQVGGVIVQGMTEDSINQSILPQYIENGSWSSLQAKEFNIGISRILANKLRVRLGEQVRLISTQSSSFTPFGRIPRQRIVTISAIFNVQSEMDDKVAIIHLEDLARINRFNLSKHQQQRFFLYDAFDYSKFTNYLESQSYDYQTWMQRQGALFDAVKMEKNMMVIMLMLVVAVASFNVVSALVMVVSEKQSDIAILKTQGMKPAQILLIFLYNGLLNGVKGLVGGLFLGLLICWQLNTLLDLLGSNLAFGENGQGLPIEIQVQQLVLISLISLLLCFIASCYPAIKAQNMQPARGLQNE